VHTADDAASARVVDPGAVPVDPQRAMEAARFLDWDLVDEWGAQSFPASDPPANW
jgi:hypothetical protein